MTATRKAVASRKKVKSRKTAKPADMKALQGAWDVVALEVEGQKTPAGAAGDSQIILKGDKFTTVSMGAAYSGTFKVDAKRKPHTIDILFTDGPHAGMKSLGILTLKNDTWTLCLGMAGATRPKSFVTKPGSGHALETLKRSTGRKVGKTVARTAEVPTAPSSRKSATSNAGNKSPTMGPEIAEHGGDWAMVSLDQSGKPAVPAEYLHYGRRVVNGDDLAVTMNGQTMLKASFTVDVSTKPKSIDYTLAHGGKKQLGIYEFDGDTARYCMAAPGDARPTDFATKTGDGRTLSVWKKL